MLLMIALLGLSQAGTVQPARQAPPKVSPPKFWVGQITIPSLDPGRPPLVGTIIVPILPDQGAPGLTIGNAPGCNLTPGSFGNVPGFYGIVGPGIGEDWCNLDNGGFDGNYFTNAPPDVPLYYTPWPFNGDPDSEWSFDVVEDPEIQHTVFNPWRYTIELWYMVPQPEIN